MADRDAHGRFVKGHRLASRGGRARAAKLTAAQRRAIAKKGWRAMVAKHFDGDQEAAKEFFWKKGLAATDSVYDPVNRVWHDPGTIQDFLEERSKRRCSETTSP
jgi:hypothetical protein